MYLFMFPTIFLLVLSVTDLNYLALLDLLVLYIFIYLYVPFYAMI